MKKLEKLKTDRSAVAANLEREKAGEARENILRVLGRTLWGLDQQIEWAEAGNKLADFKHDPEGARKAVR